MMICEVQSFQLINQISSLRSSLKSFSNSSLLSSLSLSMTLTDVSKIANKNINECLSNVATTATNLKLVERPGFSYALGCNEWTSSGYKGTITNYNANKYIDWLTTCHIIHSDDESHSNNNVKEQFSIFMFMTPDSNIPHFEMTITSLSDKYTLHLDYIPRKELIADMNYFDLYFDGLEKDISNIVIDGMNSKTLSLSTTSLSSVLSKLVSSPFSLDIILPNNSNSITVIEKLCENHIKRWCNWMLAVKDVTLEADKRILFQRDIQLRKLQYDHMKFNFAQILGAEFAPMAAEIAVGIIGPTFSSELDRNELKA